MTSNSPCVAPELIAEASRLGAALRSRNLSLVTAESCTAGLFAATLAQVDGAATFLEGAFVTYTKEQKTLAVGVSGDLLKARGSVNEDVARALAEGALRLSQADLGVAITGVLGPEPDEDGNPVGLVFIACAPRGKPARVARHEYGKRHHDQLRRQVIRDGCALVLEMIATL